MIKKKTSKVRRYLRALPGDDDEGRHSLFGVGVPGGHHDGGAANRVRYQWLVASARQSAGCSNYVKIITCHFFYYSLY